MGQERVSDILGDLDAIDRRVRVLKLSDAELAQARSALSAAIFETSDYLLKVIDDELLRRELFPCL